MLLTVRPKSSNCKALRWDNTQEAYIQLTTLLLERPKNHGMFFKIEKCPQNKDNLIIYLHKESKHPLTIAKGEWLVMRPQTPFQYWRLEVYTDKMFKLLFVPTLYESQKKE